MSSSTNWTELVKDRKGIRTKDNKSCGNIIGNDEKNIIIEEGGMRQRIYRFQSQPYNATMVLN